VSLDVPELLVDDGWVELLEERMRLPQLLSHRERRRSPSAGPAVVAGENVMGRAIRLPAGPELRLRRDDAVVTEVLVELLAAEGKERREHHLEIVHAAERDVQG